MAFFFPQTARDVSSLNDMSDFWRGNVKNRILISIASALIFGLTLTGCQHKASSIQNQDLAKKASNINLIENSEQEKERPPEQPEPG